MNLPYSSTSLSVPIVLYDPNLPPFVPQVQCLPHIAHLLPRIAAEVINEASRKAHQSPARTFCYNMLVNRFWQNNEFAEVVKLTADYIGLLYQKGLIRTPEMGVTDAAAHILALYTSNLIFLYPDLKSEIAPQLLEAAFQNVPVFNNLQAELQAMYQQPQPMQPQMAFGPGPSNNGMAMPGSQPVQMVMMPNGQWVPMVVTNQGVGPQGGMYPQQMVPSQQVPQAQFNTFGTQTFQNNSRTVASLTSNPAEDIRQDRFFKQNQVINERYEQEQQQQKQVTNIDQPVKNNLDSELVIEGGNEVNRAQHQITFLGESYKTDNVLRTQQFAEQTEQLVKTSNIEEENQYVYPNWISEPTLDSAILSAKIKQLEAQRSNNIRSVFRCFALAVNPLIATVPVQAYMDNLRDAVSFTDLATRLMSLGKALSIKQSEKPDEVQEVVNFLNTVEIQLTALVNDFLRNALKLTITIDSFTSDIGELGTYLYKKYGVNFSQGFMRFENDVIQTLLEEIDSEVQELIAANINLPEDMYYGYLPINYSFTFVFMSSQELGYKLKDEPVIIDEKVAPNLYALAKSLNYHKKSMGMTTIYDLLITSDGVRYRLLKHAAMAEQYLICKF